MKNVKDQIVAFLKDYAQTAKMNGYVIGVSGGVDSAVVSTLCAETGLPVTVLSLPIKQKTAELDRADIHIQWLKSKYSNVNSYSVSLNEMKTFNGLVYNIAIFDLFSENAILLKHG